MMAIYVLLLAMMMIAGAAATAEQVEYLATHPQQSSPADHRLSKRMDLEVCIGHFDVHKNTIIRTGESQAIGGKYLQGLELDTIEECERLCCETDSCDVYIFERKTGGYCYLFECGPPENFHCKFTRHSNYTSAVLTPQARQTSELASTPRPQLPHIPSNNISQQEWELSNLKLKPEARDKPSAGSLNVAPTGSGSGAGAGVAQAAVNPVQSGVPTAHCSRFQFTCHSGECIAVYNACDGIPQCEDGSDEGPECDTVSSSATKSSGSSSNSNSIVEPVKPMVQQYLPVQNVQQQLQVAAQQQQQQQQQQQPQHVIVLGPPPPPPPPPPMVNNREDAAAWANRKMITEGQQQQQLQPQQQLQLQQQQQQPQQGGSMSTDEQSHIFSHKGGLQLQQPPANVQVQGQLQGQAQGGAPSVVQVQGQSAPLQVSGYDSNQAMYGMSLPRSGMYVSQQQQQPQNPQQQLQQAASSGQQMPPNVVWPQQQQQQLPVQQVQQPQQAQVYAPAAPAQHQTAAMLPVLNAAPAQGKNQAPSVDGDYEDYDEETYTEAPKKKQHKHKKVKAKTAKDPIELALEQNKQQQQDSAAASLPSAALLIPVSAVHEQYKMIHENLAMEFRDHDGHSERPGGAVLSLTLGLLVTAALAILIGCRMRTVSRRARRLGGKTPYSQEADFLVNGMYL